MKLPTPSRYGLRLSVFAVGLLTLLAYAQVSGDSQNAAANAAGPNHVLSFLNQSIEWYRHFPLEQQLATEPGDLVFLNEDRRLADQIIRLSFEFALAEADRQPGEATAGDQSPEQSGSSAQSKYRSLLQMAAKADQQVEQSQGALKSLQRKLAAAKGADRKALQSAVVTKQSELQLAETRRDTLRNMAQFVSGVSGSEAVAGSLRSQVDALQRAVPAALAPVNPNAAGQSASPAQSSPSILPVAAGRKGESSGILGLISELISLTRKIHTLDDSIRLTDALAQTSKDLRAPLAKNFRQIAQHSDQLATESSSAKVLAQQKKELVGLTREFKQVSAAIVPLGKQAILLDLYKRSLTHWRGAVNSEYNAALKGLLVRLGGLLLVLAALFGLGELWRRAILRYVQDVRRRYQFLLLRRIVMWFVAAIVIAFAFATELGSLATFAGLLTAGIAVALQNVILSVAGYFFLVGKHGVRVGDRVQISNVTGEVVDIGLVRLYLIELGSGGSDAQPTGRVVAFSNSVVFQPTNALFKQIPGSNFVWHQITLTLAPESSYRSVEERLMGAVESVFSEYRDTMEQQRQHLERSLSLTCFNSFEPHSRLHLTQNGLEVVIRYPLELEKAAEVDDRITRTLLDAIERPPKLKLVGAGTPNLQPVSLETVKQPTSS